MERDEASKNAVRVPESVLAKTLRPMTETIVPIVLQGGEVIPHGVYLLEPSRKAEHQGRAWRMARGLVRWSGNGSSFAIVANLGTSSVHLQGGAYLGNWERVKGKALSSVRSMPLPGPKATPVNSMGVDTGGPTGMAELGGT